MPANDLKIFVVTHKKFWMPEDSVYIPLHAGRAGKHDLGFLGDNTGDNISDKNAHFCELTAQYWAWKNVNCQFIGFCHYRRYFGHTSFYLPISKRKDKIYSKSDYEELLQNCDIIVPQYRNYFIETVRSHFDHAHNAHDMNEVESIINEMFPDYKEAFYKVMNGTKVHLYNMYVMRKEIFDKYCLWLFTILFKIEEKINISKYNTYQSRVFGFISERLLDVWIIKNNLLFREVPVVSLVPTFWPPKIFRFLWRKFFGHS